MMEFNGTAIILGLSFIIFSKIMSSLFYSPVDEVRKERKSYIDENLESSKRAKDKAQELLDTYNQEIKNAQKEGGQVVSVALDKAKQQKAKVIDNAHKEADFIKQQNAEKLTTEEKEAIAALKPEVLLLAHDISKKILGDEVPISVSQDIIDNALNG